MSVFCSPKKSRCFLNPGGIRDNAFGCSALNLKIGVKKSIQFFFGFWKGTHRLHRAQNVEGASRLGGGAVEGHSVLWKDFPELLENT